MSENDRLQTEARINAMLRQAALLARFYVVLSCISRVRRLHGEHEYANSIDELAKQLWHEAMQIVIAVKVARIMLDS